VITDEDDKSILSCNATLFHGTTSSGAKPEQNDIKAIEDEKLIHLNSSKYLQDKGYGRHHITLFSSSFLFFSSAPNTQLRKSSPFEPSKVQLKFIMFILPCSLPFHSLSMEDELMCLHFRETVTPYEVKTIYVRFLNLLKPSVNSVFLTCCEISVVDN